MVLPVPDGPENTKWRFGGCTGSPSPARSRDILNCAESARTWRFTGSSPTIRSRASRAASSSCRLPGRPPDGRWAAAACVPAARPGRNSVGAGPGSVGEPGEPGEPERAPAPFGVGSS